MPAEEALSTLDDIKAALHELNLALHERFPKNIGRLAQLDYHIATAGMAVEHLFDEQARADHARAERIRAAEKED
jgi:hypothetical protein